MSYASREIPPEPYRKPTRGGPRAPGPRRPWRIGLAAALALIALAAALVFGVQPVRFETEPAQAQVRMHTASVVLAGRRYVLAGAQAATVSAPGHESAQVRWRTPQPVVRVALKPIAPPDIGALSVTVTPAATAQLFIDGAARGTAPGVLEDLPAGRRVVELRAEGFEDHRAEVEIRPGGRAELAVALTPRATPGVLTLHSDPPGADVLVDGTHRGRAPVRIEGKDGAAVATALLLPGHEAATRTWTLTAEPRERTVALRPRLGVVEIETEPAHAAVLIDGAAIAARTVRLTQAPHTVEVQAPGYQTQTRTITPHPDHPRRLRVSLVSDAVLGHARRTRLEQKWNLRFRTFQPRPQEVFELATTRRRIPQALSRPFAILDREVSNAVYRRFRAAHDSGSHRNRSLNEPEQPAVNISWEDAARFANWLSREAGAEEFYIERDGAIAGFRARSAGYRLPSEAEWLWLTRGEERFVWGGQWPPPANFGNIADRSAAALLPVVETGYHDARPVSAPVASFAADARGLYDLPGNVAEWVHNVYAQQLRLGAQARTALRDSLGAQTGALHVIRGFGWRDARAQDLMRSRRQYARDARDDVGFRLAYYPETGE